MLITKTEVELDQFNTMPWEYQNRYYQAPAVWDPDYAPSGYFISGVGHGNDLAMVGVTRQWSPVLKSGHYFIGKDRFYSYNVDAINNCYATILSDEDFQEVSGYYVHTVSQDSALKGYYGYKPAFLGNFVRVGDRLIPDECYEQKRAFSHISDPPSGYPNFDELLSYENTATDTEFVLERVEPQESAYVVTGTVDGRYYEETIVSGVTVRLAATDISAITGYITDEFPFIDSGIGGTTKKYFKLSHVPVIEVQSVVLESGGTTHEITGYVESPYLPGVIYFDNSVSGDPLDPYYDYPSGSYKVTYKTGLHFLYENSLSQMFGAPISINPLHTGSTEYYLLLTHTEIDPVDLDLSSGLFKRCFVAGIPVEFTVACEFNEAPILNYPVYVQAGLSRLSTNTLTLNDTVRLPLMEEGKAKILYVPPKAVDDESFYFHLGMYTAVVDYGSFVSGSIPSGYVHGVAHIGDEDYEYRDVIILPTPKQAKPFMDSVIYSVHDIDRIRNNDFIGKLGVLRIRGLKQAMVMPSRLTSQEQHSSKHLGLINKTTADNYFYGVMSEVNYKFRTDSLTKNYLTFRPYGTQGHKIFVYVNGHLIGEFTDSVGPRTYSSTEYSFNLGYEYQLNEQVTFTEDSDTATLDYTVVAASGQALVRVTDVSFNEYTENTDYSYSGNLLTRLSGGSIPVSGDVYVSYLRKHNYLYTDTMNTIRFVSIDNYFTADQWDVVDVKVSKAHSIQQWDNDRSPAAPIGFYKRVGTTYEFIPLDRVLPDMEVDAIKYYNLPHSVEAYSDVIGYYIYLPGKDYISAYTYTSYGKMIHSSISSLRIDAPDYMKGFFGEPTKYYGTNTPYTSVLFYQAVK